MPVARIPARVERGPSASGWTRSSPSPVPAAGPPPLSALLLLHLVDHPRPSNARRDCHAMSKSSASPTLPPIPADVLDSAVYVGPPRILSCIECGTRIAHSSRIVSTVRVRPHRPHLPRHPDRCRAIATLQAYRGHAGKAVLLSETYVSSVHGMPASCVPRPVPPRSSRPLSPSSPSPSRDCGLDMHSRPYISRTVRSVARPSSISALRP